MQNEQTFDTAFYKVAINEDKPQKHGIPFKIIGSCHISGFCTYKSL